MERKNFGVSRIFVCCSNVVFLISGFTFMSLGALLLADDERILLSRLLGPGDIHPDQPLFYYMAFAIVGLGFLITLTGLLGCWATCLYNRCVTVSYLITIILLLLGECTVCILVVFWPHVLGIDVRPARLIRALQRSYAVPGREQFTAALDLAQTAFACCGINGSSNYGTSWWRLQEVGRRELVVPLSCCTLTNVNQTDSFLNPEPANLTLCQALNPAEHQYARHTTGCLEMLEKWTQEQALILLTIGLAVIFVEVGALLSTFFVCSKSSKRAKSQASTFTSTQTLSPFSESDHDFEGSEGKSSVDTKNMKVTTDLSRLNDVRRFSKSIIEEWKNPSKFNENVLRSDQLYEERAIDVVPDYFLKSCPKEKNDLEKVRDDKKNGSKSKSHNSSGTVRSIPIKNYQASIAHNIGTLRRSEAPQLQFESSISEPDKSFYVTKYKTVSSPQNEIEPQIRQSVVASKRSATLNPSRRSCHSCDYQCEVQSGHRKVNSKLKTLDRRMARSDHNVSVRKNDQDFADFGDYFHKSSFQKSNAARRRSKDTKIEEQSNKETMENDGSKRLRNEARVRSKWGTIDLERGHVGQKISAYEENAKRSSRNWETFDTYQVFPEIKKHRAIGVPLVGMHNACGLPVVASWHDHELLEPLRVKGRVLGTLRPIFKGQHSSINFRHRTHPKRKMPTNHSISRKNRLQDLNEFDKKIDYPSIKSLVSLEPGMDEVRKKRRRRPSFKAKRIGTFSSKSTTKRKGRSHGRTDKENTLTGSFRRKSFGTGSVKRQTLYARDDGEEAVQVLKSLCLNPLARTKSETDMIW
ncbi:hypothetical protein QLX08_009369 [Tetragonisca angustula]|uniref:Tetraspanin n=1 Tax=Tetragonisca angustula TaxID=166442 RepID=A0AAW0ZI36_9HYME